MYVKNKLAQPEPIPLPLARRLASLTKPEKRAFILRQSKIKALTIKYTWAAWARDKQLWQLEANWPWQTWLLLSGRGFGKTRSGAELTIDWAKADSGGHIALVGRTVADVRDVMIGGRSGILACSPPWFRPEYQPSKRRLTWPNGCIATTYSADAPDQLRGPSHTKAWADERCFIAGTLIRTSKGLCPIEEIQPGDLVYTREGLKRVKHAGLTNPSTTVYDMTTTDGRTLTGTANHPVWVQNEGFKPLHSLSYGDILMVWEQKKTLNKALSGVAVDGGSMGVTTATEKESCCTEPFIQPLMDLFHQECTSTTKMATKPTTIRLTSKRLHQQSISLVIPPKDGEHGKKSDVKKLHGNSGMSESHIRQLASIVEKSLRPQEPLLSFVTPTVGRHIDEKTINKFALNHVNAAASLSWFTRRVCATVRMNAHMKPSGVQSNAYFAAKRSGQKTQGQSIAQESVDTKPVVRVKSVTQRKIPMAVFNMEVEDCHEYYANDILVHNCAWTYDDTWDQLQFGLRDGALPQCVVTTTPRATKSTKDLVADPGTHVTRGNTYENRANLAKKFINEIERRYAGTRLGRQEIEGAILDDNPGALWKREWIESLRVREHPDLKRIVVAVDPAVKAPSEAKAKKGELDESVAETGIVVAGLGLDGQGYILADYSLQGKPSDWADAVVTAYNLFQADAVVGEDNNGGDLVEVNVRTAKKNISYSSVHASRGKMIRAEPVSSLYQQRRVHHVGTFPDLEDQLCNWEPGMRSPDRLDALVWALTELMLEEDKESGIIIATEEETNAVLNSSWEEATSVLDWYS